MSKIYCIADVEEKEQIDVTKDFGATRGNNDWFGDRCSWKVIHARLLSTATKERAQLPMHILRTEIYDRPQGTVINWCLSKTGSKYFRVSREIDCSEKRHND